MQQYFNQMWNYADQLFIWSGFINVIVHFALDPQHIFCKIVIIIVLLMAIVKTFFYLRVFPTISYIVILLQDVVIGLKAFIIFYLMLIFLLGLIFSVLGLGNKNIPGDLKDFVESRPDDWQVDMPNEEYNVIGPFLGSIIFVMRCSVGDFDFDATTYLTEAENVIFWLVFVTIFFLNCIVFLNFIISEIGATYEKTREKLEGL